MKPYLPNVKDADLCSCGHKKEEHYGIDDDEYYGEDLCSFSDCVCGNFKLKGEEIHEPWRM